MRLHEYLESTYISTNLELQKEYTIYRQARTHATKDLIDLQRKFYKIISYPILIISFIMIKLHILKQPPQAMDIAKSMQNEITAKAKAQFDKDKAESEAENVCNLTETNLQENLAHH